LNLLQRVAGAVVGVVFFVLALVFASVIFAVVAVLALAIWAWLLWRTRNLPKREQGTIIEGEYRVERDTRRLDERG